MRKIRGGKEKNRGVFVSLILASKEGWLTFALIGLWAMAGVLMGVAVGRTEQIMVIAIVLVFLAILLAGLVIGLYLDRNLKVLQDYSLAQGLKEQYNGFALVIAELERNLRANGTEELETGAWLSTRGQVAYFPPHLYQELINTYAYLMEMDSIEGSEFRRVIHDELHLPSLISKMRDWQDKIKKELYFV